MKSSIKSAVQSNSNRLNPVKSCPNQGSFCPQALIAADKQGIYGSTYSPKPQVQQPPGGKGPATFLSPHQRLSNLDPWAPLPCELFWNRKRLRVCPEFHCSICACHLHSYTTDVYMYKTLNAEMTFKTADTRLVSRGYWAQLQRSSKGFRGVFSFKNSCINGEICSPMLKHHISSKSCLTSPGYT